ncbi:MAG: YggT family protein [Candidatus Omnitrophica bacterium]|nr:YggT family protein [Candidatus Omnitrophota bacterium]
MFIVGNFIIALGRVLEVFITMLYWLVLIRAIVSWVNPDPFNSIVQFLYKMTEPFLLPFRRLLFKFGDFGFDISPIVLFLFLLFLRYFLINSIIDLGIRLK